MSRITTKDDNSVIQLRATAILVLTILSMVIFLFLFILFVIAFIEEESNEIIQTFIVIVSIFIILFIMSYYLKGVFEVYKTRHMEVRNGYIIVGKMVGKLQKGTACLEGEMKYQCDKFLMKDICKIGYSIELYGHLLEFHQWGTTYQFKSYEMVFELTNGNRITFDASWFSKKKMKKLFNIIYKNTRVVPEKKVIKKYRLKPFLKETLQKP